ncbi:Predicted membrane protein [Jannaschia faecimaris]|uniref:Predicted membrane protein n=1 Tax=Jannaschia faecimaris TaxID=1244108 RepID=A0A1H3SRB6_9RHOB|nr:DUF2306 domain-containing protein [Jannaschia faecimaris]SDZ40556.1 Predicted membrane protein [Jannaschia faecimaris]
MTVVTRREWALLAFILVYSFIPTFGGLFRVVELFGGPSIAPPNPRAVAAPLPVVLHILSSFLFCIVGGLQFLPSLRHHHPALHRAVGRVIASAGCVSGLTGLWMTHAYALPTELQGEWLYRTRIILSLSMVGLIAWAFLAIRVRNVTGHRAAMLRAYAIAQGASTQTVLGICWMIASGTELLGPVRDGMMIFSWAINFLAAEIVIGKVFASPSPQT